METIYKRISEYPDTWRVSQGDYDGKPISIRYREGLIEAQGHFSYPFQIGVATPLLNPSPEGLTINDEAEALYQVEDALQAALELNEECVFALTITTGGMREFVFYASKWQPQYFEQKVQEINSQYSDRVLQFMMKEDKEWNTFKDFLPENVDLQNKNLELKQQLIAQIDDLVKQIDLLKTDDDVDTTNIQKIEVQLSALLSQLQSINPDENDATHQLERYWDFPAPDNAGCFSLKEIVFADKAILHVFHEEEGGWQFLGLEDADEKEIALVHVSHLIEKDSTLMEIGDLPRGWHAWRGKVGGEWTREEIKD
jgi:hypothetical protein